MEFRKIFDTIPEQFDKYRPRYTPELFAALIAYAQIGPGKSVLEIGPGTGQATDPVLQTGCDYHAIELGENLFAKMQEGEMKELKIIVKGDVQGSVEAVRQSLEKLSNDEVRVHIIHGRNTGDGQMFSDLLNYRRVAYLQEQ